MNAPRDPHPSSTSTPPASAGVPAGRHVRLSDFVKPAGCVPYRRYRVDEPPLVPTEQET
ncbi:hypothetical protein [Sorangium sp. So ce1335]|uniref:hypothetical protein n=1 Tax=Sorangium sp. So ce1335 TaxID=3133335 RepID=UPI003F6043D6